MNTKGAPKASERKSTIESKLRAPNADRLYHLMFGDYGEAGEAALAIYQLEQWRTLGDEEARACFEHSRKEVHRLVLPHAEKGNAEFFRKLSEALVNVRENNGELKLGARSRLLSVTAAYEVAERRAKKRGREHPTIGELRGALEAWANREWKRRHEENADELWLLARHRKLKERFCHGLKFENSTVKRGRTKAAPPLR